jgi:Asp/Glu/hydantoin racemase
VTHPPRPIALIHTVAGLIPTFDTLLKAEMPDWAGFNMLDESLLRLTIRDGAPSAMTMRRLAGMVGSAVDAGAQAVVVTCSSLGPAVEAARPLCPVPLYRIDEGMAVAAVTGAARIGVLATLGSTLTPTGDLIRATAARLGRSCTVTDRLAEGAFQRLQAGDVAGHDAAVADQIRALVQEAEVVVLAQASMARALATVAGELGGVPVLTSPELGIRHIRDRLAAP